MHLIDAAGHVDNQFVHEDPATNRPPTEIDAAWLNAVQNELANAIRGFEVDLEKGTQDQLFQAISKAVARAGGLPRFTAYVWGGRGGAMPEGDTQSSGQQLLDLMYPSMRQDVAATQFYCTEAEWQADPYKRVTHWSLGDGASWMRPPDKNGVQPGNVGAFYGVGANPAGAKPGTAVIDAMRNIVGTAPVPAWAALDALKTNLFKVAPVSAINLPIQGSTNTAIAPLVLDVSLALPAGTMTDPVTGEFRPRTWYGIWMIRMYGRVTNAGDLNAPALNARMDLLDARVSSLEAKPSKRAPRNLAASRVLGVTYTNTTADDIEVNVAGPAAISQATAVLEVDGKSFVGSSQASVNLSLAVTATVPPGKTYKVPTGIFSSIATWLETTTQ